jgi:hypothetical protein
VAARVEGMGGGCTRERELGGGDGSQRLEREGDCRCFGSDRTPGLAPRDVLGVGRCRRL